MTAGLAVAVDVIVAASLKCFHQRALAAIAKRDDRKIAVLLASARMILAISNAPISRMFVAQRMADGVSYSSVVSAKAACVLGHDLEALPFQRVAQSLCEIHIAVDQQNPCGTSGGITAAPPPLAVLRLCTLVCFRARRKRIQVQHFDHVTVMRQPPAKHWDASDSTAAIISALISSHSPVTGIAIHSRCVP